MKNLFFLLLFPLFSNAQVHHNLVRASLPREISSLPELSFYSLQELGSFNKVENNVDSRIMLNPNPNRGMFSMHLDPSVKVPFEIVLLDLAGRIAWKKDFKTMPRTIQVGEGDLKKGVYVLKVNNEEEDFHRKVIVY